MKVSFEMKICKTKFLAGVVLAIGALVTAASQAGTITIGSTAASSPNHFENFDVGTLGNNVSNQFSANGLTFSTISGHGATLTNNTQCGNGSSGVANQYLYIGVTYPCGYDGAVSSASLKFNSDVSELSWTGFSRAGGLGYAIEALENGVVVSNTTFNFSNGFGNETVLFSGSNFNEIQFLQLGPNALFFAVDNLSWRAVPAAAVPLPGTVALLALGLCALGFSLQMRKSRG